MAVVRHPNGQVAWDGSKAFHANGQLAWDGTSAFHDTSKLAWNGSSAYHGNGRFAWSGKSGYRDDGSPASEVSVFLGPGVRLECSVDAVTLLVCGKAISCLHAPDKPTLH